jgi:hypothetical protein
VEVVRAEQMLTFLNENWMILSFIFISYGWLLRLGWRVDDVCKDQADLQNNYKTDICELKEDLKENVRLLQTMNLSLTGLSSYLHGKGFYVPKSKGEGKKDV